MTHQRSLSVTTSQISYLSPQHELFFYFLDVLNRLVTRLTVHVVGDIVLAVRIGINTVAGKLSCRKRVRRRKDALALGLLRRLWGHVVVGVLTIKLRGARLHRASPCSEVLASTRESP